MRVSSFGVWVVGFSVLVGCTGGGPNGDAGADGAADAMQPSDVTQDVVVADATADTGGEDATSGDATGGDATGGDASAQCADLALSGSLQIANAAGAAPQLTGGTIADGDYVATTLTLYGDAGSPGIPPGVQFDMRFQGSTYAVIAAGAGLPGTQMQSGTYQVEGNVLHLTMTCGTGEAMSDTPFTATSTQLSLGVSSDQILTLVRQ